jgi:hypothetical protein
MDSFSESGWRCTLRGRCLRRGRGWVRAGLRRLRRCTSVQASVVVLERSVRACWCGTPVHISPGPAGYRHRRDHQPDRADQLRQVFARPIPLIEGANAVGDPLGVLPALFHMLWRRELQTDLRSTPLSEKSLVRVAGELR